MKAPKDYTIHLLLFIFGLALLFNLPACYRSSNTQQQPMYDYSLVIVGDTIIVRDTYGRFVGKALLTDDSAIGCLIYEDNE